MFLATLAIAVACVLAISVAPLYSGRVPLRRSVGLGSSLVLAAAAILGDTVNYSVGRYIGPKAFDRPDSRWFKQAHLRRTKAFYDKYGGVTIIIGRFVPIIRTFAPFLAGVVGMRYRQFIAFNVVGGIAWIASLVYAGYLFGNIPWVKENLSLIVIGIVVVSLLPAITTFIRERRGSRRARK